MTRTCTPRQLLVGGAAALAVSTIGHLLWPKACGLPYRVVEDYLPGVRAGIEPDKDSPHEPSRQE